MKNSNKWAFAGMVAGLAMAATGIFTMTLASKTQASASHAENPIRVETFGARGMGSVTRVYDTETGFVCYFQGDWARENVPMGSCKEVKRSQAINERYGVE
uniref:Uncharacterized protein n=1 Tax=Pseudomonas phage HRDY3 TaxID=3236930 RepID=A0AB39CDM9_9VIRU